MEHLRRAHIYDTDAILACDTLATSDDQRSALIRSAIADGTCTVALDTTTIVAYGILDYSFYDQGFIRLLVTHPSYRRRGIGLRLIHHLLQTCLTSKVFTSTNLSNTAMQQLLTKAGLDRSGIIYNLDKGDPELVFCYHRERG